MACAARLALPAAATAAQRLDHVDQALATEIIPLVPNVLPAAVAGFRHARAGRPPARRPRHGPATADRAARPAAQRHDRDGPRAVGRWPPDPRRTRPPRAAAARHPHGRAGRALPRRDAARRSQRRRWPGSCARYGHRAVAEIDLGLPRWSEDPAHVLGVLANYLRLEDPALAPDALFARGAAEAEQMIDDPSSRRRGRPARPRSSASPSAGRGRWPACASCRSTTWSTALAAVRAAAQRRSAPSWPRGAGSRRADDVFFLDAGRGPPEPGAPGRRDRPARGRRRGGARSTTASCAAGTCPASCSPTARSPKPSATRGRPGGRAR